MVWIAKSKREKVGTYNLISVKSFIWSFDIIESHQDLPGSDGAFSKRVWSSSNCSRPEEGCTSATRFEVVSKSFRNQYKSGYKLKDQSDMVTAPTTLGLWLYPTTSMIPMPNIHETLSKCMVT